MTRRDSVWSPCWIVASCPVLPSSRNLNGMELVCSVARGGLHVRGARSTIPRRHKKTCSGPVVSRSGRAMACQFRSASVQKGNEGSKRPVVVAYCTSTESTTRKKFEE